MNSKQKIARAAAIKARENFGKNKDDLELPDVKYFPCAYCDKYFTFRHLLKRHMKLHSNIQSGKKADETLLNSKPSKDKIDNESCICHICQHDCANEKSYLEHIKIHNAKDIDKNSLKTFEDIPKKRSNTNLAVKTGEKAYKCRICSKTYVKNESLIKHELQHEGKGSFRCRQCGEAFPSEAERTIHKQLTHIKSFHCTLCSRKFSTDTKLDLHIRWHERKGSESFVCNLCGKEFKLKVNLKVHVESRCGTEPQHICQVCGKAFMTRGTLATHTLLHTGEKTFLCAYCGKCFHLKVEMQRHERSHTGEKPFVCKVCNKAFAHRESLVTHNTLHTGIRPYMCECCGSTFSCIGNLIKHRKTHRVKCKDSNEPLSNEKIIKVKTDNSQLPVFNNKAVKSFSSHSLIQSQSKGIINEEVNISSANTSQSLFSYRNVPYESKYHDWVASLYPSDAVREKYLQPFDFRPCNTDKSSKSGSFMWNGSTGPIYSDPGQHSIMFPSRKDVICENNPEHTETDSVKHQEQLSNYYHQYNYQKSEYNSNSRLEVPGSFHALENSNFRNGSVYSKLPSIQDMTNFVNSNYYAQNNPNSYINSEDSSIESHLQHIRNLSVIKNNPQNFEPHISNYKGSQREIFDKSNPKITTNSNVMHYTKHLTEIESECRTEDKGMHFKNCHSDTHKFSSRQENTTTDLHAIKEEDDTYDSISDIRNDDKTVSIQPVIEKYLDCTLNESEISTNDSTDLIIKSDATTFSDSESSDDFDLKHKIAGLQKVSVLYNKKFCDNMRNRSAIQYINGKICDSYREQKECHFFKCTYCDEVFTSRTDYNLHKITVHEQQFLCILCRKSFSSSIALNLHLQTHNHEDNNIYSNFCICGKQKVAGSRNLPCQCVTQLDFKCHECDRTFMSQDSFKAHLDQHNNEQSFLCKFCDKKFQLYAEMQKHERLHEMQSSLTCEVCGKVFTDDKSLLDHNLTHNNLYMCDTCGSQFATNKSLTEHMQIHKKSGCDDQRDAIVVISGC